MSQQKCILRVTFAITTLRRNPIALTSLSAFIILLMLKVFLFCFVFPVPSFLPHIHTLSLQAMLTSLQRGAISHPLQPVTFPSWVHVPEELQNVAVGKIMSWKGFLEKDFIPVSIPWRVSMDFLHGTITPSQTSRLKEDFTSAAAG